MCEMLYAKVKQNIRFILYCQFKISPLNYFSSNKHKTKRKEKKILYRFGLNLFLTSIL